MTRSKPEPEPAEPAPAESAPAEPAPARADPPGSPISGGAARRARQLLATDALLGVHAIPTRPAPVAAGIDHATAPTPAPADAPTPAGEARASPARQAPAPRVAESAGRMPDAPPTAARLSVAARELHTLLDPIVQEAGDDAAARAEALGRIDADHVQGCTRCPLHEGRTRTVFGVGNPDARLLFIGEGPGQNEDEQGEPFVGRAGELLNKQIEAMGLKREDVFIANIVKCRPPQNRAPKPDESDACSAFLHAQIRLIRPEVIVTLGGPAAKFILHEKLGITRLRGNWGSYVDPYDPGFTVPVMPTFHPAYLLRSYTRENRAKVWSDLQQVIDRLGLGHG